MVGGRVAKMASVEEEAEIAIDACSYELKCPVYLEEYDHKNSFVNVCFSILSTK